MQTISTAPLLLSLQSRAFEGLVAREACAFSWLVVVGVQSHMLKNLLLELVTND